MAPDLALQDAIVNRLKQNGTALYGLIGGRVYDRRPPDSTFPLITIGPAQTLADKYDCVDGSEVFLQIDVWSRRPGFPECKGIVSAVHDLLDEYDLTVTGQRLITCERESVVYIRDPDGLTSHAALTYRVVTEPTA